MTIGLLECDHVRDEFQYISGDYRDMFPALFLPLISEWQFVFYDVVNGHFPEAVNDCNAYICTGSKSSVYDDEPWIVQLKGFVSRLYQNQKPFIGLCFGHQLLGESLGGKVGKSLNGWCVGVHQFDIQVFEDAVCQFVDDVPRSSYNVTTQ
jgi:GMP synthase-like glutamine amidotransferase